MNSIDGEKKESEKYFYQFCTEFFIYAEKFMKGTKEQRGNLTEYRFRRFSSC